MLSYYLLNILYCRLSPGCEEDPDSWPQHECDIMVPGQQLWHTPPVATGDDLRWQGRLRANAAGVCVCVCVCLSARANDIVEKLLFTRQTPAECHMNPDVASLQSVKNELHRRCPTARLVASACETLAWGSRRASRVHFCVCNLVTEPPHRDRPSNNEFKRSWSIPLCCVSTQCLL